MKKTLFYESKIFFLTKSEHAVCHSGPSEPASADGVPLLHVEGIGDWTTRTLGHSFT